MREELERFAAREQVPLVDLTAALGDVRDPRARQYRLREDPHPSPEGHRVIAEALRAPLLDVLGRAVRDSLPPVLPCEWSSSPLISRMGASAPAPSLSASRTVCRRSISPLSAPEREAGWGEAPVRVRELAAVLSPRPAW